MSSIRSSNVGVSLNKGSIEALKNRFSNKSVFIITHVQNIICGKNK